MVKQKQLRGLGGYPPRRCPARGSASIFPFVLNSRRTNREAATRAWSISRGKEFLYLIELRDSANMALGLYEEFSSLAAEWLEADDRSEGLNREGTDAEWMDLARAKLRMQTRLFMAVEAFLSLWARVSLLLFGSPRGGDRSSARAQHLRMTLNLADSHPVSNRTLRDHWTHYDERLDNGVSKYDHVTPQVFERSEKLGQVQRDQIMRLIEVDTLKVYFLGEGFELRELYSALADVERRAKHAIDTSWKRWHGTTLQKGLILTRDEIHDHFGGSKQSYLPHKDGRVVAGCFNPKLNPEAPDVVLPGKGPETERLAEVFSKQREPVPVFLKRAAKQWEYVGDYRVRERITRPKVIQAYARRTGRPGVTQVLRLEEVTGLEAAG